MPATLESALVIIDRASGPVRGIRREVKGLQKDAEGAGRALDDMAGPKAARDLAKVAADTKVLRGAVRGLRDELPFANRGLEMYGRRLATSVRETDRLTVSTDRLTGSLRTLGAIEARPTVQIDGLAASRAELAALRAELRAFGASRPTARVGVSGSIGGGIGGGGRTAAYFGSGGAGIVTSRTGMLAGAAVVALPVVQALGGATTALAGSLMGAGLGGGAVGLAGGGALAAGLGSVVAVAKPAQAQLKGAMDAQTAYNDAVKDFGSASAQAVTARREMNQAFGQDPGLRRATRELSAFRKEWNDLTGPGREAWFGLRGDIAQVGRRAAPRMAQNANIATRAVRTAGTSQARFLAGDEMQDTMAVLTREFARDLPVAEHALEGIELVLARTARAARPFFREGVEWIDQTTSGWERSTRDAAKLRREVGGFVEDLKDWGDLTGSAFELVKDVLMGGRPAGGSMVRDLTETLDRWDRWVDRNPERIDRFFRDAADDTERLASGVASVVRGLHDLGQDLRPLVPLLERLGDAAGALGSLGPGGLAIAAGAYGGLRGRGGGLPGRGGGSAALGSAAIGAAGGAAWLTRGRATYGAGRALGAGRLAAGAGAFPAVARGGGGAALRGAAGKAVPISAIFGLLDAYGFEGGAGQKLQAGASTALGTLTLGASNSLLGRPQSRSQLDARSSRIVDTTLEGLSQGSTSGALLRDVAQLRERRGVVRGMDVDLGSGSERDDRIRSIERAFDEEITTRRRMAADLKHTEAVDRNARSREHAGALTTSFGKSYDTLAGAQGPEAAMDKTVRGVHAKMRGMNRVGAQILGENVLGWAAAQARANPALLDEVEWLNRRIRRSFSKTGEHVEIVNGKILTGSRREWNGIAASMIDPAERARQEVTAAFTAIQQRAVGSLRAMGFSPGEARKLVAGMEKGGKVGKDARTVARRGPDYDVGPIATGGGPQGTGRTGDGIGHTRDGIGDGPGTVATMQRSAAGQAAGDARNVNLMGAKPGLGGYAAAAAGMGLRVSSGLRPGAITSSGNPSMHGTGDALDVSGPPGAMLRFAQHAAQSWGSHLEELIHTPMGFGIKNGRRVAPYAQADHFDHVHIADTAPSGGGGPSIGLSMDTAGPGMQRVSLKGPGSRLRGVPGALSGAAGDAYAAGLEEKLNAMLGAGGPGLPAGPGGKVSGSLSEMIAAAGLPPIFGAIINAESGGDPNARNPSGASGLTQIMTPLHNALVARYGGNVFDPATNLRVAKHLYDESGLAPWTASRHAWGDGIGWDRPSSGGGGGPTNISVAGGRGHTVNVSAPVRVGGGGVNERRVNAIVDRKMAELVAEVLAELDSGQESVAGLL